MNNFVFKILCESCVCSLLKYMGIRMIFIIVFVKIRVGDYIVYYYIYVLFDLGSIKIIFDLIGNFEGGDWKVFFVYCC